MLGATLGGADRAAGGAAAWIPPLIPITAAQVAELDQIPLPQDTAVLGEQQEPDKLEPPDHFQLTETSWVAGAAVEPQKTATELPERAEPEAYVLAGAEAERMVLLEPPRRVAQAAQAERAMQTSLVFKE